jgi:hypothetical protein
MSPTKGIVSTCIPIYEEENSNVGKLLANLRTQIPAEIVIGEYDHEGVSRLKTN